MDCSFKHAKIISLYFVETNYSGQSRFTRVYPECVARLIHLGRVIHPFPTFTHSHTHYAPSSRLVHTTLEGGVRRRSNHPLSSLPPHPSHSNRIVSIINETALRFSEEPRFRVTVFRVDVYIVRATGHAAASETLLIYSRMR